MAQEPKGFSAAKQQEIAKALKDKGADKPCSRCGKSHWQHAGFGMIPYSFDPNAAPINIGSGWAVITMACANCGYIIQHVVDYLGVKP